MEPLLTIASLLAAEVPDKLWELGGYAVALIVGASGTGGAILRWFYKPLREDLTTLRDDLKTAYAERRADQIAFREELGAVRVRYESELREMAALVSKEVVPVMTRMIDSTAALRAWAERSDRDR